MCKQEKHPVDNSSSSTKGGKMRKERELLNKRIVRRKRGETEDTANCNKNVKNQNQGPTSKISKVDCSNNNHLVLNAENAINQVYRSNQKPLRNHQEDKRVPQEGRGSPLASASSSTVKSSIPVGKATASFEGRSVPASPSGGSRTAMNASPSDAAYAGAKFNDPPSPKVLPKPPVRWFSFQEPVLQTPRSCSQITEALKGILNVQA